MQGKGGGGDDRLFIANLSYNTDWKELTNHCSKEVAVHYVRMQVDPESGNSVGRAVVELVDGRDTERAIRKLNGTVLDGRPILVRKDRECARLGGKGGQTTCGDYTEDRRGHVGGRYVGNSWDTGVPGLGKRAKPPWDRYAQGERHGHRGAARSRSPLGRTGKDSEGRRGGGGNGGVRRDVPPPPPPSNVRKTCSRPSAKPLPTPAPWKPAARPAQEQEERNNRLFAEHLALDVTRDALLDLFAGRYNVIYTDFVAIAENNEAYGIIEFETLQDTLEACHQFGGVLIGDKPIRLRQDRGEFDELKADEEKQTEATKVLSTAVPPPPPPSSGTQTEDVEEPPETEEEGSVANEASTDEGARSSSGLPRQAGGKGSGCRGKWRTSFTLATWTSN